MFYQRCGKRSIDIVFSILGLVVLSPLLIVLSVVILIFMGWPLLFVQERPGKDEDIFKLYKFRTMRTVKKEHVDRQSDERRLTKLGSFLRKTSLDELPELFNILKGDMSLVGPRPLLVEYLPLYNRTQKKRHEVRPGLTGLAQINGRNAIKWSEKFKYDIKYVETISFINDLKILLATVIKVFKREGIASEGLVTAKKFKGNQDE